LILIELFCLLLRYIRYKIATLKTLFSQPTIQNDMTKQHANSLGNILPCCHQKREFHIASRCLLVYILTAD